MNQSPLMEITLPDGKRIKAPRGSSLLEILQILDTPPSEPVVAAKINNRLTNLRHKLKVDSRVEFIGCTHPEGYRVYQSSLSYLLGMAVHRVLPAATLKVEHSLSKGLYCTLEKNEPLQLEEVALVEHEMFRLAGRNLPLEKEKIYLEEARLFFKQTNQAEKIRLFRFSNPHTIDMYCCDDYWDYSDCPLVPNTGLLEYFHLIFHPPGLVMIMPEPYAKSSAPGAVPDIPDFIPQPKLFNVYQEFDTLLGILEMEAVGALNERVVDGRMQDVIRIFEVQHEKKIAQIADAVCQRKVVLIGGPSSSGKTTFSKRLSDQLTVLGLAPVAISLDDYFLDREHTPRDEHGRFDFESIRALDLDLLQEHFQRLFDGAVIGIPRYDFLTGTRKLNHRMISPRKNTILIFEGIHAITPELTRNLDQNQVRRVYVSPLTTLCMDNQNRIPTTDVRLLRRIVRDYLFRGYDALDTLRSWQSVRRGETHYIFPYQKDADLFFNSALVYELAVLKRYAEPLLYRISTEHPEYSEARRLLKFLSYFQDIPPEQVPSTSILREFIGKSGFSY